MIKNLASRAGTSGMQWWTYLEICDRCGATVHDESWEHSCPPDEAQSDFCLACLRHFIDNNIDYKTSSAIYKK